MKIILFISLITVSCTIPRRYPKGKPFIVKNSIEVKGGKFTKEERATLKQRLNAQLDDSSKVNTVDKYFIRHIVIGPPAYDSASANKSARNMETSMLHLGYYKAQAGYHADTNRVGSQERVHVTYTVEVHKPTLIDTVSYFLRHPDLQELALQNRENSLLKKGEPVTKAAVLGELARLVELYRNNGYYKFTSEELRMRGDTTVEELTTISGDIFEQMRLLAQAQAARDSPTIKLAVVLNPPADSSKLKKYYINNIYILPDYRTGDKLNDSTLITELAQRKNCDTCRIHFIVKYHKRLFKRSFLNRNLYIRKGDLYNQADFYKTLNSFSKAGVWQSTSIQVMEVKDNDSVHKIDLVIQLSPVKKYGYEASVEVSYSASSNTNSVTAANAGNLLGLSGNFSIIDRNLRKEGVKMTNSLRAGVEFNLKPDSNNKKNVINSNELSYANSIVYPRFIFPLSKANNNKRFTSKQSFLNNKLSYINRINLFNLQSFNVSAGYDFVTRKNYNWTIKALNIEFARLYNETDSFKRTLNENPFLRYSFNTSLIVGHSAEFRFARIGKTHPNRQYNVKVSAEESGFLFGIPLKSLHIFDKYMRQFVKADLEFVYSSTKPKSAFVYRFFWGLGYSSKADTTLPFFKQYFGGGSNSMRAWPVRGIGRGSQPLAPYGTNKFNDRTGDIQFENNFEYRYTIAQIIPNSLILRGALFMDVGNVWNYRNSQPNGGYDPTQMNNFYKELGVAAGTGFRLDFNYLVLRFDLGFRMKRPDVAENDGWQIPNINFNNLFRRGVQVPDPNNPGETYNDNRYKKWRYENFNFAIGIGYSF